MIILTGAGGFIGSVLLHYLNSNGIDKIICVDCLNSDDKWKNLIGKKFIDLIDYRTYFDECDKFEHTIEAVIHLGACNSKTEQDMDFLLNTNYRYTKALFHWCQRKKARFLYASSAATYGSGGRGFSDDELELKPLNKYAYSKHLFDVWCQRQQAKTQCVGMKFFNVYGPNEYHKDNMGSLIYQFYRQVDKSNTITIYGDDGLQSRDFIYVKDVADVIFFFLNHAEIRGVYNIGSGISTNFNIIAKLVIEKTGKTAKIQYEQFPDNLYPIYQKFTKADLHKLRAVGYNKKFTSIEDGIEDYINTYLNNHDYL